MSLGRRGFLQSAAAAFVIGPGLLKPDKRIRPPIEVLTPFNRMQAAAKLILDPHERLMKYRTVLTTVEQQYYKGPKIESVTFNEHDIVIKLQRLIMQERVKPLSIALYSPEGEFRTSRPFHELHRLNPGDSFNVTYLICF